MCSNNNRRLARFYDVVFGLKEVWNSKQNSPYALYIGDGNFQLNCLQIHPTSGRVKIVNDQPVLPKAEINHIGFQVNDYKTIEKILTDLIPGAELIASRPDGRYEDFRLTDFDGNDLELSKGGWDAGKGNGLPLVKHVGIQTEDPEKLAHFYQVLYGMKEVGRREKSGTKAIYLSDGTLNLGLVKNSSVPKPGIQVLGFQIKSLKEIEERLKQSSEFLYPGEVTIEIEKRNVDSPYKTHFLKDPDGNYIEISEEGWEI